MALYALLVVILAIGIGISGHVVTIFVDASSYQYSPPTSSSNIPSWIDRFPTNNEATGSYDLSRTPSLHDVVSSFSLSNHDDIATTTASSFPSFSSSTPWKQSKARIVIEELVDRRSQDLLEQQERLGDTVDNVWAYDSHNPFRVVSPNNNDQYYNRQQSKEGRCRPGDDSNNDLSLQLHLKSTTTTTTTTPPTSPVLPTDLVNDAADSIRDAFIPTSIRSQSLPLRTSAQKLTKTGTTIAGCCIKDQNGDEYVILAADTRATEATMVADKRCEKVHKLSSNIWCCGAGTSADLDHITRQCRYSMALHSLQYEQQQLQKKTDETMQQIPKMTDVNQDMDYPLLPQRPIPVERACRFLQEILWEGGGSIGANLILGGVWDGKAYLRAIHPHGSMDIQLPFAALGSGGLAAMGVLEQGYNPNTLKTLEQGIRLVQDAIVAGIRHDLGSGSQVDLCVIHPDGTSMYRRCVVPEEELSPVPESSGESSTTNKQKEEGEEEESYGANGFGNIPFVIQSKQLRRNSSNERRRVQMAQIKDLLSMELSSS